MPHNNIKIQHKSSALGEIANCIKAFRSWLFLGYIEVRFAYRRTILGPLWTTLSITIIVSLMSFFWSKIFNIDLNIFLPHMVAGYITWIWMSNSLTDNVALFSEGHRDDILFGNTVPLFYIFRACTVGFWTFLHQIIIVLLIYLFIDIRPSWQVIYLFPFGVLIIFINTILISTILSILNVIYRDIKPLMSSVIPPLMLITPVIWLPSMLGDKEWVAIINPFTHFIALIRAPLLNYPVNPLNWYVAVILTLINFLIFWAIYSKLRRKMVFWL